MKTLLVLFCAVFLFGPRLAVAHPWCKGADGVFAEDLIKALQNNELKAIKGEAGQRLAKNLGSWLVVNEKIAKTSGLSPRLFVCNLSGLTAFVTTKTEPVRVGLETVDLLGISEDAIAAILGHEYAHLVRNHVAKKIVALEQVNKLGGRVYQNVWRYTRNANEASNVADLVTKREWSAFSVDLELEADDLGIQLLSKSGYKPTGFLDLAAIAMKMYGGETREAFPSHPGFLERMAKGEARVKDEIFDQRALALVANDDRTSLSDLVTYWFAQLPNSGNVNYYKSILMRHAKNRRATETMEDAFMAARPSISKSRQQLDSAWLWLCTQLYREGYGIESAWCAETQLKQNDMLWSKFQARTFQDRMWVGYNGSGNDGNGALLMSFIRKPDGGRLITNLVSTAESYGIDPERQFTPLWRPVRFKPCIATTENKCPRVTDKDDQEPLQTLHDPFREVRASCKPPYCRGGL